MASSSLLMKYRCKRSVAVTRKTNPVGVSSGKKPIGINVLPRYKGFLE